MKSRLLSLAVLAVALLCAAGLLASCRSSSDGASWGYTRSRGNGPPPHAPAHGYRRKHSDLELVYDSQWGVYVVVDFPSHFYYKKRFYRHVDTHWEMGVNIDGPWKVVSQKAIPPGIRAREKSIGVSDGRLQRKD
ncbi:MAG: hypothetical protein ABIF19_21635 [Planctomycetota bacterium]